MRRTLARFERHAIAPERVAELIVNAIERERFLVITSADIKALYFFKRCCHPVYHFILCKLSDLINAMRSDKGISP